MAIDRTGITSLDAGAGDITYSGNEGPRSPQQIAGGEYNRVLELLEKVRENIPLSEEEKMELQGLIKTLTAKGVDVEKLIQSASGEMRMASADPMLQDEYDKYIFEMEEMGHEPMSIEQFKQQAVSGMAQGGRAGFQRGGGPDWINTHDPGPMGNPAIVKEIENAREFRIANPNIEDVADYKGYYERLKKLEQLKKLMKKRMMPMSGAMEPPVYGEQDYPQFRPGMPFYSMSELNTGDYAYGGSANPTYTQKRK